MTGSRPYDMPRAITWHFETASSVIVADKKIPIKLTDFLESSARQKHSDTLVKVLTSMDIPEVQYQAIIDEIFRAVQVADVPGPPIYCLICDTILRLTRPKPKVVNLECLEKVRLYSLDDITRREICVVCRESLDHFEDLGEGTEDLLKFTRLPCRHLYHGDCIVKWSEVNHLCPLCREPMPTIEEEEEEVAAAPRRKLNWPMIVTGGIIAAMLLWKQK